MEYACSACLWTRNVDLKPFLQFTSKFKDVNDKQKSCNILDWFNAQPAQYLTPYSIVFPIAVFVKAKVLEFFFNSFFKVTDSTRGENNTTFEAHILALKSFKWHQYPVWKDNMQDEKQNNSAIMFARLKAVLYTGVVWKVSAVRPPSGFKFLAGNIFCCRVVVFYALKARHMFCVQPIRDFLILLPYSLKMLTSVDVIVWRKAHNLCLTKVFSHLCLIIKSFICNLYMCESCFM